MADGDLACNISCTQKSRGVAEQSCCYRGHRAEARFVNIITTTRLYTLVARSLDAVR